MQTQLKTLKGAWKASEDLRKLGKGVSAVQEMETVVAYEDILRVAAQLAAIVDKSGLAATVGAYTYAKCSTYFKQVQHLL